VSTLPSAARATLGRVLLASAALMLIVAGLCWFGTIAVPEDVRSLVSGACLVIGVGEGVLGLRLLGES
jgi:hypothetical protein